MWVTPDRVGVTPGYEQRDLSARLDHGGLHPIASGQGHAGAVAIHQRDAVLWGGRLHEDDAVSVPQAPHVHVFVARGAAYLDDEAELRTGDAARLSDAAPSQLTATAEAELLIWATA